LDSVTRPEVISWIAGHASAIEIGEALDPIGDLAPLAAAIGDSTVVGLGASTYGAHEHYALTCRIIRFLVQELGFRSVVTEEDWDKGLELDRFVQTGEGDLTRLLADAGVPWRTQEVRDLLVWLRAFNVVHAHDPVRFHGVGVIDTRPVAYELVERYVASVDPGRSAALKEHLDPIRPVRADHVRWFFAEATDRELLLEHARRALAVVEGTAGHSDDREYAFAVQNARQIVAFYEHYVEHLVDDGYRDRKMAENISWIARDTGNRIAYWSTNAHSVRSPELTITMPPREPLTFTPTGTWLRDEFGDKYLSVGLTFEDGTVNSGWALPPFLPRPVTAGVVPAAFAEFAFAGVPMRAFLLDLRTEAPGPVTHWLRAPTRTRVIGSVWVPGEPAWGYSLAGGSLSEWFDVIVHARRVTPSRAA
jgi:erythromycin esterase